MNPAQLRKLAASNRFDPQPLGPSLDCLNVAILGFANASESNEALAAEAGRLLAATGCRLVAGNLTSTFFHAFQAAKAAGGITMAILEPSLTDLDQMYCDQVEVLPSQGAKHKRLLEVATAALVIGGGPATLKLVKGLLECGTLVIAVANTGGVTDHELPHEVPRVSLREAVARVTQPTQG